ncbi:MAG TPA: hypothetical protein VI913_01450, partial [Candidatus Peribacteraceae bacterium]|nr:hypothetical protein [Candidatus Peribacteraceae bacterium]
RHLAVTWSGDPNNAAVLSAQIDLTACLDLTDRQYWSVIRHLWETHVRDTDIHQLGVDEVFRRLRLTPEELAAMSQEERNAIGAHEVDCRVMNIFIQQMKNKIRPAMDYTTVRGAFVEGNPIYDNSWLWNRSAVVVSVIEPQAMGPLSRLTDDEISQLSRISS